MRYEKGHKDTTHQHIVDVASALFRKDGVAATGIAGIMTEAGLTNGAFYCHFASKEDLVRQMLSFGLSERKQMLSESVAIGLNAEQIIRNYLSPVHRDNPDRGCLTSALVAEVARHPGETRRIFTENIEGFIELLAEQLLLVRQEKRRATAIAIYSMLIGTLQLSRAVSEDPLSNAILSNGVDAALDFIQARSG
jgi:TetR/AcrR family transcriptional repressor of nem operon